MVESIQKKLGRVRPPRVHITYDVETGGAIEKKELPFIVGVLSNFSGMSKETFPPIKERKFIETDRDNFDDVMAACAPRCAVKVQNILADKPKELNVELFFRKFDDFEPLNVINQVVPVKELYDSRCRLRDMLSKLDGNDPLDGIFDEILGSADLQAEIKAPYEGKGIDEWKAVEPTDTMKRMFKEGRMVLHETQQEYSLELVGQFAESILADLPDDNKKSISDLLNDKIKEIDVKLSNQLNLIMHAKEFQKIEATWRGLHYLVFKTETGTSLKIRVLNVSKADLLKDMQKALEFDQSGLFKLVYEAEYGTYGGYPYSLLIGDYEFGRHPDDTELLDKISGVASAAHAPFVSAAYAKLFDMEDFFVLAKPRDLSKIFESNELIKWRSFRESEDSRYVTLTLPRVLLRLPYGKDTRPAEGFDFTEDSDGKKADKYLWGNSAYILGERITNAFSLYNWTAAIRGVEGGGLVEDLPVHTFKTDEGDIALTCPTQVSITDRREKELNDLGFMTICHCKGTDKAAFFGGQTTNLPKKYMTDEANANARISAMLPYMLAASRFAHYIQAIMREKVGSFFTRGNVEDYLNSWISNYILLDDAASQGSKAKFPLRDAKVVVTDVPGKPGAYKATAFLRPHFQLEELTTSIRLVADIPA